MSAYILNLTLVLNDKSLLLVYNDKKGGIWLMNKQTEYEALREEILLSLQTAKNYRSILYTVVVALLAFAFEKDDAILFLIPFAVIIPLYLLSMHQIDSSLRMGAYIYVFLERGTDCQWETRLLKYDNLYTNQYDTKKPRMDPYWYIGICCLGISVAKLDYSVRGVHFFMTIIAQIVILIAGIYIFLKKRPNYLEVKKKYIKRWEEVRSQEEEIHE